MEAALLLKNSYRRFPTDDEFRARLIAKDVYNFRSRNYLLDKLENEGHKEPFNLDEFTIEHIMPQTENLDAVWLADLGPDWKQVHDTYLHTLGNLTLTAYNSEYSARPFLDKRDLKDKNGQPCGFAHSPLLLNQGLGLLDHWNENEIKKRAEALADKAVKIWKAPDLTEAVLKKYGQSDAPMATAKYTYENYADELFGDWFELSDDLRSRVLGMGLDVKDYYHHSWVNFSVGDWFLNVVPQQTRIRVVIKIDINQVFDPAAITSDASAKYLWAQNSVVTSLKSAAQLDDVIALIQQAYDHSFTAFSTDGE